MAIVRHGDFYPPFGFWVAVGYADGAGLEVAGESEDGCRVGWFAGRKPSRHSSAWQSAKDSRRASCSAQSADVNRMPESRWFVAPIAVSDDR
jgi:hypothetical protein